MGTVGKQSTAVGDRGDVGNPINTDIFALNGGNATGDGNQINTDIPASGEGAAAGDVGWCRESS